MSKYVPMARRRRWAFSVTVALLGSLVVTACQTPSNNIPQSFTAVGQVISGHANCIALNGDHLPGGGMACFSKMVGAPGECVGVTSHNGPDVEVGGTMPLWPVDNVKARTNC